jgi:hypothetical protein
MLSCLLTVMLMASTGWGAGFVKRELWEGATTTTLNDAVLVAQGGSAPTTTSYIAKLDFVGNTIDGYVDKFTAWLVPPVTGNYVFYISSDDDAGVWIVPDANDKAIINVTDTPPLCRVTGWRGYGDYTSTAEQASAPVALQAGIPVKMVVIHRDGTGGDYATVAWTLPGSTTIDVIGSQYFAGEQQAGGPIPADGQTNVKSGLLSWLPPAKWSGKGTLTYDVYLSTDPNLFPSSLVSNDQTTTAFDAGAVDGINLQFGKNYYWRVDVTDPNTGGTGSFTTGEKWTFTTNDGKPFIVTAPGNVFGILNGSASFTVVADTLANTTLSYQWSFKTFFGTTWTDIQGATGPTYTKDGLQPSDRGLYRVRVYDTLGNEVFAEARLYMRIGLVNRYSFTDNANDSVSGANGTIYQSANYPATFIDAPGTSGDPTKRQLYLANGPTRTGSAGGLLAYVDLPNGVISTLGTQATFMAWFTWRETDTGQNWQRVFDFGNSTGGENVSGTGNNYLMLTPRADGRTPRFGYKNFSTGEERYLNASASLTTTSGQVCYAITWNEDTGRTEMYRNGKLVSAGDIHFKLSNVNDINNWLGRAQFNDNGFWGNINEFRIYDQALPAFEIAAAYALGPDTLIANPCVNQPSSDINNDCVIDLDDFALIAAEWLDCGLTTCP